MPRNSLMFVGNQKKHDVGWEFAIPASTADSAKQTNILKMNAAELMSIMTKFYASIPGCCSPNNFQSSTKEIHSLSSESL
jgi:hypothetical protein